MFTGIVSAAEIVLFEQYLDGYQLKIHAPTIAGECKNGDSVAIDGVCLTVVSVEENVLTFYVSPETIQRSIIKTYIPGLKVNIELPLRPIDRLGGHYVLGHVDCTGNVTSVLQNEASWFLKILIPHEFKNHVVYKGSIAINGVSLTINQINAAEIELCIIPVTLEKTNLSTVKVGSLVNIEVDILAKYTANLLPRL
jgi:riboflavin synthase